MDDYFQKMTPEQRKEWWDALIARYGVELDQRIRILETRVMRLERGRRMTAEAALEMYDALKRMNPDLTLQTFADDYGLKYGTLMRARQRRRNRDK